MNLTDRQVKLIEGLLTAYNAYREGFVELFGDEVCAADEVCGIVDFVFNNKTYKILRVDVKEVCEIIDYIKGVKK